MVCAAIYGAFDVTAQLFIRWRLSQELIPQMTLSPLEPDAWSTLAAGSLLPASEQLAAVFTCLIATFPVSSCAALLLLLNYRNLAAEFTRGLHRHFGKKGLLLAAGIIGCGVADLLKPTLLLALPELSTRIAWNTLLPSLTLLNLLSFVFEYLVGTALQLYLLFLAYSWVRGIPFEREKLLLTTTHRTGKVFLWSLMIIGATVLTVHLPLLAEALITGNISWITDGIMRPLLAVVILMLGPVQIRLALHNDSLREAWRENFRFLKKHGILYAIFLLTAFGFFAGLQTAVGAGGAVFSDALSSRIGRAVGQLFMAGAGGWVLAAWVCFYKSRESGFREPAY